MIPPRRLQSALIADRTSEEDMIDAPEHQVESRLLLDVVVRKRAAVLELLARKDKALLVGRDTRQPMSVLVLWRTIAHAPLLVLNLRLHIVDCVRRLNLEGDRLPRQGLDENLHFGGSGGTGCRRCRCRWRRQQ